MKKYFIPAKVGCQKERSNQSTKLADLGNDLDLQILEQSPNQNIATAIFALATLNNAAQVHFELCEYSRSRISLMALSKLFGDVRDLVDGTLDAAILEALS